MTGEFESGAIPTVLEQVAVLTVRTEMAAAYLGLAGGR